MNWQDVLLDMGLSYVFTLLKKIPKSPELKKQMRSVMLKIAKGIFIAYPEEEFTALAKPKK